MVQKNASINYNCRNEIRGDMWIACCDLANTVHSLGEYLTELDQFKIIYRL